MSVGTLRWVEVTGSTQDDVKALARAGAPEGTAIAAGVQTAGRGRLDRRWESAPEAAVLLSVVLRPHVGAAKLPLLALALAAAAVEVLDPAGATLGLKWPNDVLARDGRKVAGVLAEAELVGGSVAWVVAGIGVNAAGAPALPAAASLAELGLPADRRALGEALVAAFVDAAAAVARDPAGVLARWRARSLTLGRLVRVGDVTGVAVDVAESGALTLRGEDGALRLVHAGDVHVVGMEGR